MTEAPQIRDAIRRGEVRGAELRARLDAISADDRDAWLDRVLGIDELPDDGPELPPGGVPYLPCAVDDVLAILDACAVGEGARVVDLGSGLGRVPIVVHLLTGATAHGIEVQSGLVSRAREIAASLALTSVTFEHADVRDAALEGDLFVMYAPFSGAILEHTIERLGSLGRRNAITVATIDLVLPATFVSRETSSPRVRIHSLA